MSNNQKNSGSSYRKLRSFKNVQVKYPGPNDSQFRLINKHSFVNAEGKTIEVAKHVRRGDMFNGRLVTKNFFIGFEYIGETFVADQVDVVSKTSPVEGETLVIDIFKHDNGGKTVPQLKLKVGSPTGDFLIPGTTDKYIKLEPVKVACKK